jgi:hypothetical protein
MTQKEYEESLAQIKKSFDSQVAKYLERRTVALEPIKKDLSNFLQVEQDILSCRKYFLDEQFDVTSKAIYIKQKLDKVYWEKIQDIKIHHKSNVLLSDSEIKAWMNAEFDYCLIKYRYDMIKLLIDYIEDNKKLLADRTYELDRIKKVIFWKES